MASTADAVVIGAGFAGASTAAHLVRRGLRKVVIVEREALPGTHSSGRNAGMARQTAVPPAITPLAAAGVRFLRLPPADWPYPPVFSPTGSLFLVDDTEANSLVASIERDRLAGLPTDWYSRQQVVARVPLTAGGAFCGGAVGPDDGVADIADLIQGFIRTAIERGARLLTGQCAVRIETSERRIVAVETDRERIETTRVVNAAGAWAGEVAVLAGATSVPLRPCRRHLFLTGPQSGIDRGWPSVWDLTHGLYFRPEPPGLLLSPCDETDHSPGSVPADPAVKELLAAKIARCFPRLIHLPIARSWAGLRTLTPDGGFALGSDPLIEGFFWCAGLGGHGMTVSFAVGDLVAGAVFGEAMPSAHAVTRFASGP